MNDLGVYANERINMEDKLGKNPPKRQYCCPKMEFVANKLKQKTCPFCNKKL
jgi:hypothetical protein